MTQQNKTVFITGSSRGIGEAIALRFAKDGANVVIAAKTVEPHPKLPGTIYTVAKSVEQAGGKALPLQMDVRDEQQVQSAIAKTIATFGGIDILINNVSAIYPYPTLKTPMKRFDLMFTCNVRATFLCSQACIPHLKKSTNPHILNIAPPLNMEAKWFKDHLAYTMSKYGMSMCTLGMSAELAHDGIAVNSLWPKTTIATSAVKIFFPTMLQKSRKPAIMADAAHAIVSRNSKTTTGNFYIDETVLHEEGVEDFDNYALDPTQELQLDLFLSGGPAP